jgi:hypothetical protein
MVLLDVVFEKQREIIESDDFFKCLSGVAGSLKTNTLVLQVIWDAINFHKLEENDIDYKETKYGNEQTIDLNNLDLCKLKLFHGCINTLTGSVTEEIKKRLEFKLNIKFMKVGSHYIYKRDCISIDISSMDGFIHTQLKYMDHPIINERGDYYDEKTDLLIKDINDLETIRSKNDVQCTHVYSDEFQDMKLNRVKLLSIICIKRFNIQMRIYGDILQTIYAHSIKDTLNHPILGWCKETNATHFNTDICFRCPPSHLKLLSYIFNQHIYGEETVYNKYNVFKIKPSKEEITKNEKPIIFTHPATSNNVESDIIGKQITNAIKVIMDHDNDIKPGDIAIIMKKCNGNSVFHKIHENLNKLYKNKGFNEKIHIFETKIDGSHDKIDWQNISDENNELLKTIMISIHGDKGMDHKVVIFLGLTEGSLPMKQNLYKQEELTEISCLNVALTRSTKYLLIGFSNKKPSRYIKDIVVNNDIPIKKLAICTWYNKGDEELTDFQKEMKNKIIEPWRLSKPRQHKYPEPKGKYLNKPIYTPINDIISPSEVYDEFTEPARYVDFEKKTIMDTQCKQEWNIDNKSLFPIVGIFGELLFMKILLKDKDVEYYENNIKKCITQISDDEYIYYTDNDNTMNIVTDSGLNKNINKNVIIKDIICGNQDNILYKKTIDELKIFLHSNKKYILPKYLKGKIKKSITRFIRYNTPIDNSLIIHIWNISVMKSILESKIYKTNLQLYIDNPPVNDIENLIYNCKEIIESLNINNFSFQKNHKLLKEITERDLNEQMGLPFNSRIYYGICGKSDIINCDDSVVIDIKTPMGNTFSNGWISQIITYLVTPLRGSPHVSYSEYKEWNKASIIDITNGIVYNFEFNFEKKSKSDVIKHILNVHDFNKFIIDKILDEL